MQTNTSLAEALEIVRLTDVGLLREHNEDTVASDENIGFVILADGMGGYKAGEVASEIAALSITAELSEALGGGLNSTPNISPNAYSFEQLLPEERVLYTAVKNANDSIYHVSKTLPECEGMGTTLVLGLFIDNKVLVGHIGDSRMYRLRGQKLLQLTEDHSLLQEQLNAGLITIEQAKSSPNKNLVTRALGVDAEVELALQVLDVEVGDIYLLCSDGLSDLVNDQAIEATLNLATDNLENTANTLVQMANDQGGLDNISVIMVRVKQEFASTKVTQSNQLWLRGSGNSFFGWLK